MGAITVRGVVLGAGRPKILAPVFAGACGEAVRQAAALRDDPRVDVVELRLDALVPARASDGASVPGAPRAAQARDTDANASCPAQGVPQSGTDGADGIQTHALSQRAPRPAPRAQTPSSAREPGVPGATEYAEALRAVHAALGQKPLLATVRTAAEGGRAALDPAQYRALLRALLRSSGSFFDLVDVEADAAGPELAALCREARDAGAAAVVSHHEFARTPPVAEMTACLRRMGAAGADIAKLAVMPHCPADAAALLLATAQAAADMPDTPLITMSMGPLGAATRVCGGCFGSCATFGAAGTASAPGQPDVASLRAALDALQACL
jgi:3-dehydroquinate dehydratase-1